MSDKKQPPLDYAEAKRLARDDDPVTRRRLAARDDLAPEILYFLAEDDDPEVRRGVANNPGTPPKADLLLSRDADPAIRADLARKICRLMPDLPDWHRDRIRRHSLEALERLAQDQLPLVRSILSEALKDIAHAPPEVIRRLARDIEEAVSVPVLEHSPVLTDDDLLDIISQQPQTAALAAISRRGTVGSKVADAIARTEDVVAIACLLDNPSAQLREETLDALIDRAPTVPSWHRPLARRPVLSDRIGRRLALFLTGAVLEELINRKDLDPATALAVRDEVAKRFPSEDEGVDLPASSPVKAVDWTEPSSRLALRRATEKVRQWHESGNLGDHDLLEALRKNDFTTAVAALSVPSEVAPEVVVDILRSGSGKAIASLAWKAGFGVDAAVVLQREAGGLAEEALIKPDQEGGYPLPTRDMEWEVLIRVERRMERGAR